MQVLAQIQGQEKYELLRKQFTVFTFEGFQINETNDTLEVIFTFNISDKYIFHPKFSIPRKKSFHSILPSIKNDIKINQLIFNIGMIELISYWKLTCAQRVVIKPYSLTAEQLRFWLKTYYNGLGEFFFTNGINAGIDDFMQISSEGTPTGMLHFDLEDKVIVPVGFPKQMDEVPEIEPPTERGDTITVTLFEYCIEQGEF